MEVEQGSQWHYANQNGSKVAHSTSNSASTNTNLPIGVPYFSTYRPVTSSKFSFAKISLHQIYYSQDSVKQNFQQEHRYGEIKDLVKELQKNPRFLVQQKALMRIVFYQNRYYSVDNRRLYAYKRAFGDTNPGILIDVKLYNSPEEFDPEGKGDLFFRKLTTTNSGINVQVRTLPGGVKNVAVKSSTSTSSSSSSVVLPKPVKKTQ